MFLQLAGRPTDEELEAYLDYEQTRVSAPGVENCVTVLYLTASWTSTQRKRMKEFELGMLETYGSSPLALALVVPNTFVRGGLTAYFWLAPAAYPTKMVATSSDAHEFVTEQLRARDLPTPSQAEFLRVATSHWRTRQAQPGRGLVVVDDLDTALDS